MIAFFQNIGLPETIVIAVLAILIFGRRLPEVAARAAVQVQRMRRGLADLRRETGIDAEMRAARRAIEGAVPRLTDFEESAQGPRPAAPAEKREDQPPDDAAPPRSASEPDGGSEPEPRPDADR